MNDNFKNIEKQGSHLLSASEFSLSSPDNTLQVSIQLNMLDGTLYYSVSKDAQPMIIHSLLGIRTNINDFSYGLSYIGEENRTIDESYSLPCGGKKAVYSNFGREKVLKFVKGDKELHIIFRACNDGIAFRYHLCGSGELQVFSEATGFRIPCEASGWAQHWIKSYEDHYIFKAFNRLDFGDFAMPLLYKTQGYYGLITEAAVYGDYCASHICGGGNGDGFFKLVFAPDQTDPVKAVLPFDTPWRVVIIGSKLGTIVESTLVTNLNPPCEVTDTSWIAPGRANWTWWNDDPTTEYEVAQMYVDFAASMGWEYFLADAGWSESWVPGLVKYGKERGIGIFIWSHYQDLDTDEKISERIPLWASWGVKGIKVDFFESDSQQRMINYEKIALTALTNKLMLNFHGATKPTGIERRWPHIVTYEGVLGAEYYKWPNQGHPSPTAEHNCTLPFTRNVVGPADYTPVTYSNNQGETTWAHMTALPVIFHSNIQHLSDKPEVYEASIAKEFLKACPAAWDDTLLIEGEPGRYVTLARKSGEDWYIGAICGGGTSRETNIPLYFLSNCEYIAHIFRDGNNETEIVHESRHIKNTDVLTITLRKNGGCAIRLIKQPVAAY